MLQNSFVQTNILINLVWPELEIPGLKLFEICTDVVNANVFWQISNYFIIQDAREASFEI